MVLALCLDRCNSERIHKHNHCSLYEVNSEKVSRMLWNGAPGPKNKAQSEGTTKVDSRKSGLWNNEEIPKILLRKNPFFEKSAVCCLNFFFLSESGVKRSFSSRRFVSSTLAIITNTQPLVTIYIT